MYIYYKRSLELIFDVISEYIKLLFQNIHDGTTRTIYILKRNVHTQFQYVELIFQLTSLSVAENTD